MWNKWIKLEWPSTSSIYCTTIQYTLNIENWTCILYDNTIKYFCGVFSLFHSFFRWILRSVVLIRFEIFSVSMSITMESFQWRNSEKKTPHEINITIRWHECYRYVEIAELTESNHFIQTKVKFVMAINIKRTQKLQQQQLKPGGKKLITTQKKKIYKKYFNYL